MELESTPVSAADKYLLDTLAEKLLEVEVKLGREWLSVARVELCRGGNRHWGEPRYIRKVGSLVGPHGYIDIYARDF